jgi:hypothetical protein
MKKLLGLVLGLLLLNCGNAFAISFHWDVSTVSVTAQGAPAVNSGNAVNFPADMTTSGQSTITQTLTGGADDSILVDGDTFTEFGGLSVLGSGGWPGPTGEESFVLDGYKAYISYTGLSGSIFNYNDLGTPTTDASGITTDTFSLAFDAGVGDISIYIDTDFDPTNPGTIKVADLKLLTGLGTSPFPILGFPEGQFGLTAEFTSVLDNFWYTQLFGDPASEDFFDIIADPARGVIAASFNLGATLMPNTLTTTAAGDIQFSVKNEGSFVMSVVPEPTTMFLFGFGLLGIAGATRRKNV